MFGFVKTSTAVLALFGIAAFGVPASAQQEYGVEGSLGSYYQTMYLQTHWMGVAFGRYTRPGHRTVRYVHAAPVWTLSPSHAAVITHMVSLARRPTAPRAGRRCKNR